MRRAAPVYPRVGGGNRQVLRDGKQGEGLSPRGRGKPNARSPMRMAAGSIPAWAGETPSATQAGLIFKVYPRVGGGNHRYAYPDVSRPGLSPRGRGKRAH